MIITLIIQDLTLVDRGPATGQVEIAYQDVARESSSIVGGLAICMCVTVCMCVYMLLHIIMPLYNTSLRVSMMCYFRCVLLAAATPQGLHLATLPSLWPLDYPSLQWR